jgi:lantibiotic modifying enzyme
LNDKLKNELLAEAIRIGDDLLSLAEHDENGLSWKTMSIDSTKQRTDKGYIIWVKSETLYSGVSGIILFLLEFYKQTGNARYLEAATDGMRWVEHYCNETPTDYFGFYSGRIGVTYVLSRMYEVTNDSRYLEAALRIAKPCDKFLEAAAAVDDLIGGRAGTLLGLLHLHAVTQETWLLEKIDLFIKHLIDHAFTGPQGLYWDHSPYHIHGLCGFSHGASGVGFAFLEAGRYFQNEALYHIAEQAFLYESYYYNVEQQNWPDFRNGIYTPEDFEEHKKAYQEGNLEFFIKPKYMNAWCHGAAGIGLSRLRAYELLKNEFYAEEAKAAITTTQSTDIADEADPQALRFRGYTLCHAGGGNAELFLEACKTFENPEFLSLAQTIASNALAFKASRGFYFSGYGDAGLLEDYSLLMGNAGIGYFYLRVLDPQKVPSILLPKIESIPSRSTAENFIVNQPKILILQTGGFISWARS